MSVRLTHPLHLALCLAGLLLAGTASARLGGDEASVAADAQALATLPTRHPGANYTRYDLLVGKTTIHEYVGAAGQVFAVSFSGGNTPRLDVLLGSYIDTFNSGVRHDRRSAFVDAANLKARLHGHPGDISGHVWLPALVPSGVVPEVLP
jgi:hypothetical protein